MGVESCLVFLLIPQFQREKPHEDFLVASLDCWPVPSRPREFIGSRSRRLHVEPLEPRRLLSIFTVNSAGDFVDGDPTTMSLREAILAANVDSVADRIEFNIPGVGVHTIQPNSALPTIINPVVIDGYTQPGASVNTNPLESGLNSVLMVELDGSLAGSNTVGLRITAGGCTVSGLVINRFGGQGVLVSSGGGNRIEGNFIGADATGEHRPGQHQHGIYSYYSPGNVIVGNLVSGNQNHAIKIDGGSDHRVEGNYVGADASGSRPLGNGAHGGLSRELLREARSLETWFRQTSPLPTSASVSPRGISSKATGSARTPPAISWWATPPQPTAWSSIPTPTTIRLSAI